MTRYLTPLLAALALTACQPKTADAPASGRHANWFSGGRAASTLPGASTSMPKGAPAPTGYTTIYPVSTTASGWTWSGPTWVSVSPPHDLGKTCIYFPPGMGENGTRFCQSFECAPGYIPSGPNSCKPGHVAERCLSRPDRVVLAGELAENRRIMREFHGRDGAFFRNAFRRETRSLQHALDAVPTCPALRPKVRSRQ